MTHAAYVSLRLTRFDALRPAGEVGAAASTDVLFCGVGADSRAAGTEPTSMEAFVFALIGLHPSLDAARRFSAATRSVAPWMHEGFEAWSAVLQPFRHFGESNHLDRANGGPLFETLAGPPAKNEPIVMITSAGWRREGLDLERVRAFSAGVGAVRAAMTGVFGLHSQQSFFFPGALEYDPVTISTWRNVEAMRSWACGAGVHRLYLERHRARPMADRTSFTRYRILQSAGTWYRDALQRENRSDRPGASNTGPVTG